MSETTISNYTPDRRVRHLAVQLLRSVYTFVVCAFLSNSSLAQTDDASSQDIEEAVLRFHQGLVNSDSEMSASSLADNVFMWNGDSSDDPTAWQAHLFLAGDSIDQWITEMIESAGPHENAVAILDTDIRGDSGLVVTQETGRNRFRSWEQETVVYSLGRIGGNWKIVGLFVRDISNPE